MTITPPTTDTFLSASHPAFCEGGIACEARRRLPADWEHRGHETTFHVLDKRVTLALTRGDGQCRGEGYRRGEVEVELSITDTASCDKDGDEITSEVILKARDLDRLLSFLEDYRAQLRRLSEDPWNRPEADCSTDDLPKRGGMTKAQEVWNAISIGEELGRIEASKS